MALSTRQFLILLSCVSLVLADYYDSAVYEPRKVRTGRQSNPERPQRRLRPSQQRPQQQRPQPEPRQTGASSERFSSFGPGNDFGNQPNYRPDGTEYDEYGNRKQYGQQNNQARSNIPRSYDRRGSGSGYVEEQQSAQQEQQYAQQFEQQQFEQQQYAQQEQQQNSRPRPVYPNPSPKRTIDTQRKAVIDEVDPALLAEFEAMPGYEARPQQQAQPRSEDLYSPASGPAYGSPSMLTPVYANARQDLGPGQLEASVLAGAEAYGVAARPEGGVYQNEERLSFQIHGQDGPHSYRYGYDTGNGFNRQFRYEERNNEGYVKGRYGFYDKYGKLQVTNYESDPILGFHAEGAHIPVPPAYPH